MKQESMRRNQHPGASATPFRGYPERMKIAVRLFAGLREQAGTREKTVELPDGATAADVWPELGLGEEPPGLMLAVNRAYVERDQPLADGDELALIPPVSGGAPFLLSEDELSLDAAVVEVRSVDAGAIATFVGTTRAHSRGRDVIRLEYEAYAEMAVAEMERLAEGLRERYALVGVAIHHRTGVVEPGETSVVIAISSAHRADALAACKDAIDTLKQTVPLWKKEIYVGGEEWITRGS
jgi:molybdopterin converting factor subunit 1